MAVRRAMPRSVLICPVEELVGLGRARVGRPDPVALDRDFHDKKRPGEPDRTRKQLRQDAEDVYIEEGASCPGLDSGWLVLESFDFVAQAVEGLFGLPCCRRRVGPTRRALSLGFSTEQFHGNPTLVDSYYGEWEIGTYYAGWRIVQRGRVLCGSDDVVDSADELNERLAKIKPPPAGERTARRFPRDSRRGQ